jgi:hypothetical protein
MYVTDLIVYQQQLLSNLGYFSFEYTTRDREQRDGSVLSPAALIDARPYGVLWCFYLQQ